MKMGWEIVGWVCDYNTRDKAERFSFTHFITHLERVMEDIRIREPKSQCKDTVQFADNPIDLLEKSF